MAAKANLEKSKASLVQTKADYDRAVALTKDGVVSQQQLDLAKANYDSVNAGVSGAAANVAQAEAQVSEKAAAVAVAQTNLDYTVIRSPIDATVGARSVDAGRLKQSCVIQPAFSPRCRDARRRVASYAISALTTVLRRAESLRILYTARDRRGFSASQRGRRAGLSRTSAQT